jgi:hypothetical protein
MHDSVSVGSTIHRRVDKGAARDDHGSMARDRAGAFEAVPTTTNLREREMDKESVTTVEPFRQRKD